MDAGAVAINVAHTSLRGRKKTGKIPPFVRGLLVNCNLSFICTGASAEKGLTVDIRDVKAHVKKITIG